MTNLDPRVTAASLLRDLGHAFAAHDLDDEQMTEFSARLRELVTQLDAAPARVRETRRSPHGTTDFPASVPIYGEGQRRAIFTDGVVAGGANPMGLGAYLSRDGDQAVMEVTLGKAFEGATDRAHGGILAALMDETMGMAVTLNGQLGLTATLSMAYRAPTPIEQPLVSRAWIENRDGRKIHVRGTISAGETTVVDATGLFIAVDFDRIMSPSESVG